MHRDRIPVFACTLLLLLPLVSACGPTYTRTVMLEKELLDPALEGISVGAISMEPEANDVQEHGTDNANRNNITPDMLYSAYREYLEESLIENGIAYTEGKQQYVTNVQILGYKEGNAFLRWLTPAGGESKVVIQATLERDGKVIGGIESQQTIAWGGAFSIGGWRHVIRWSAQKVAEELCNEMFDSTCVSARAN